MNLQEQLGALDIGVDQLIRAVEARNTASAADADVKQEGGDTAAASPAADTQAVAAAAQAEPSITNEATEAPAAEPPALRIGRPSQNEITMSIGDQTVALNTLQIAQLVEELAKARASMTPEPPPNLPQGWRFVSTKNPVMAVQKQSNGDRLLVLRHTGHGWVPFTFSPDMAVQLHLLLSQG